MRWHTLVVSGVASVLIPLGFGATSVAASEHHSFTVTPGHSIQAAIDSAHPGDTIVVEPGRYKQSLQITTDDLTLRGADADDRNTVIEPPVTAPNNLCTQFNGGPSGICVLGQVDMNGNVLRNVEGVHIVGFTIKNFPQNGVFGYGTDGLQVSQVSAFNDGGYGIARFASTRTSFRDNSVGGNAEAGLYVGDSPDADTWVVNNRSWGNGFGIFIRHSHEVRAEGNTIWDNCVGILVLDDGQAGGAGNVTISGNRVHGNNLACPGSEEGPPTSGGGIVLVGAVHTLVADNQVNGNNAGGTVLSGGIVLLSAQMLDGGSPVIDDSIRDNDARHNAPDDILYDGSGSGNTFNRNECSSSSPSGLCH